MKRQFLQPRTQHSVLSTRYLLLGIIFSLFCVSKTFSNNLTVSNLTVNQSAGTITFDLSWDNSWRNTTSNPYTSPNNWDAAWVFVKFRDCVVSNSTPFTHGLVSTNVSDHTFSGSTILEPTKRDGSLGIDPSPDNTGVMLRNSVSVTGNVNVTAAVTLKIANMPSTGGLDMRVYAMEMVFVPQGPFSIGDGNGYSDASSGSFNYINNASPPYTIYGSGGISSELAQNVYERSTFICPSSGVCALTAAFPKGYNAFYVMKYEISQGQYCDFLNSITNSAQILHYPNKLNQYRHTITNTGTAPLIYTSVYSSVSKDDRACNWLSWYDVSAYLDWAALRPLTELEYEKTCRGPQRAVFYEKAWGTPNGQYGYQISGTEDGTETITTSNANINAAQNYWGNFSGGDGNYGPLRCGIFATSGTTTREQTGAGFYGAMELSGNVEEYYVTVLSGTSGPSTSGVDLGDGVVDGSGNHNVADWPLPYVSNSSNYVMRRGGSWHSDSYYSYSNTKTNVSYRIQNSETNRDEKSGGRGGR